MELVPTGFWESAQREMYGADANAIVESFDNGNKLVFLLGGHRIGKTESLKLVGRTEIFILPICVFGVV